MSLATVRHNCVVCEIQWFNDKFKRGNKACVRKIKGDDGRLKEKNKERQRRRNSKRTSEPERKERERQEKEGDREMIDGAKKPISCFI